MTHATTVGVGRAGVSLLAPRSIAVAGASANPGRPAGRVVAALRKLGYPGEVYPINEFENEIAGYPTVRSIAQIDAEVDLLVVAVRAARVPAVLREAGESGIRNVVILSSGFREVGVEGAELEAEVVALASQFSMDVLGPNCLGYVDLTQKIAASFTTALDSTPSVVGDVALVSQSGAMGAAIFGLAQAEGIGVGSFVSTGNEAVIGFAGIVDRLIHSTSPPALLGYVEGVSDGRSFIRAIRAAREAGTRVAILKVGTTEAGQRAAQSHTGALSGADLVWDAALQRAGAHRATSPTDLLDLAMAYGAKASSSGDRIAILTMSGGAGVLMSDRAQEVGLRTPNPGEDSAARLAEILPGFSALANPIDFGGAYTDPAAVIAALETLARDPQFDVVALFLGLTASLAGTFENAVARIISETGTPIVVSWFGGPKSGTECLRRLGIPTTSDPTRAIDMAAAIVASSRPLPEDLPVPSNEAYRRLLATLASDLSREVLSEAGSKELLASAGVRATREIHARSVEQAASAGAELGTALAVKVDAPGLVHKSDVGGVELGIDSSAAAGAYGRVVAAARRAGYEPDGALICEMAPADRVELLVGTRWDAQFGAIVLVGSGGTRSEIDQDVAIDLAPISVERARSLILSLRCAPLLTGFRGSKPFDLDAAAHAVASVSMLAAGLGAELTELDVNPLAVLPDGRGCQALDAVAVINRHVTESR